jgi:transposase-like protein
MKANVKKIKKYRRYSDDFKKQVVNDYESGTHSTWELSQLHGLGQSMIYKWIYKFSKFSKKGFRVVEKSSSSDKKIKQLVNEKKELLAMLAKKQIRIEYLEKMIDLTGEEYGIDIKKNLDTLQSNNSEKIDKK